jgi:hypothetical protein
VPGHAQAGEDFLDGTAVSGIDDLGVKLLADLVVACDKGDGDRSGELPAQFFGRLV